MGLQGRSGPQPPANLTVFFIPFVPQVPNPRPETFSKTRLCEEGEDQMCVVCLTAQKTHAFVPCGHRCVCRSCGRDLLREARPCPICRARAHSLLQIFV